MENQEEQASVRTTLQKLLKLKDIDEKLAHLNRRIQDCPRLLEKRRLEYEREASTLESKRDQTKHHKVAIKQKEGELTSKEQEIRKQESVLQKAKNNQEYNITLEQIRRLKGEVDRLEGEILEIMDKIEDHKRFFDGEARELQIQKDELDQFVRGMERDAREYAQELAAVKSERMNLAEAVDFTALQLYERVGAALDGAAIVNADGHTCGGCFMSITTNDLVRIRGMRELVTCKFCQRILYLSEYL